MAGREFQEKEKQVRQQIISKREAEKERREKAFDEVEQYYRGLLRKGQNKKLLTKYAQYLKGVQARRSDASRPPPVYHWEKVTNTRAVKNEDLSVRCVCQRERS